MEGANEVLEGFHFMLALRCGPQRLLRPALVSFRGFGEAKETDHAVEGGAVGGKGAWEGGKGMKQIHFALSSPEGHRNTYDLEAYLRDHTDVVPVHISALVSLSPTSGRYACKEWAVDVSGAQDYEKLLLLSRKPDIYRVNRVRTTLDPFYVCYTMLPYLTSL